MDENSHTEDKIIEKRRFSHDIKAKLQYFEQMSAQGKHLWGTGKKHEYEFRCAQPVAYTYCCCYKESDGTDLDEFIARFTEQGWEFVMPQSGLWSGKWLYFRKLSPTQEQLALFSDVENQTGYYRQVRDIYLIIGLPVLLLCLPGQFQFESYTALDFLRLGLCGVAALICGGQALRQTLKIKDIQKNAE